MCSLGTITKKLHTFTLVMIPFLSTVLVQRTSFSSDWWTNHGTYCHVKCFNCCFSTTCTFCCADFPCANCSVRKKQHHICRSSAGHQSVIRFSEMWRNGLNGVLAGRCNGTESFSRGRTSSILTITLMYNRGSGAPWGPRFWGRRPWQEVCKQYPRTALDDLELLFD